jgi:hypothetical protein
MHLLDTGHFALEDKLSEIAPLIADFLDRVWDPTAPGWTHPADAATRPARI